MGSGGPINAIAITIAIAIAIVVGGATYADGFGFNFGFTPTIAQHRCQYHQRDIVSSHLPQPQALSALVYGVDGSVVSDDVFDNPDGNNNNNNSNDEDENEMSLYGYVDSLKASVPPPVWNTIACAFAPPPHDKLTPALVQDANPVGLSLNSQGSIDIAVAVPASMQGGAANAAANQLVRILVPVRFAQAWAVPRDATRDEKFSALLGQIRVLEGLAGDRLSQRASRGGPSPDDPAYYEKMVIETRWIERLREEPLASISDDGDGFPRWWTSIAPPFSSLEMVDEAKLLKGLLNEDEFEDELRALFVEHSTSHGICNGEFDPLVLRAAVSSIGSSGLFLKARVAAAESIAAAASGDGIDDDIATASVAYSNPLREAKTVGELRDRVLLLIESVDPMPMPARPQATAASPKNEEDETKTKTITPFNEQVMETVTRLEERENTPTSLDGVKEDAIEETTDTAEDEGDDDATPDTDDSSPKASSTASASSPTEKEANEGEAATSISESPSSSSSSSSASKPEKAATRGASSKQQPRPPDEEAKLAAKYAAIEDVGERAFAILRDLEMV